MSKAQPGPGIDNFKQKKEAAVAELRKFTLQDTNRVNALIKIFSIGVFLKQREEVLPYRVEALALSRKLKYQKGLAFCYYGAANYFKSASDYPMSLLYFDSLIVLTREARHPELIDMRANAFERMGSIYYSQENYYAALDHYLESLKYPDPPDHTRTKRIYIFMMEIYAALNNIQKADEYVAKSLGLIEMDSNNVFSATAYLAIIEVCLKKNDLTSASFYLDKMAKFLPDPKEVLVNFGYYLKRGRVNFLQEKYSSAYVYFQHAYRYADMSGHRGSISIALRYLSATALRMDKLEDSHTYAMENLSIAEELNGKKEKAEALLNLSDYYKKTGQHEKALESIQRAVLLKDSIMSEKNLQQVNVLGAIYDADKQKQQIEALTTERQQQTVDAKHQAALNKIFIVSILVLVILGYLGYNNFRKTQLLARNQQELQKQRISELEKDKQLATIDAVIKGQEEERNRIAKDLHDGLGGLLSGTKLSFLNVKDKIPLSPEHSVLFERSLSMLDNTIGDLRKVAQNLMPEALVKFGLHEATRDFCESIQAMSSIRVIYQQIGEMRKIDTTAEVFTFRIIQELVNNVVKYAQASYVIVQLSTNDNRVSITVEDNGTGFDPSELVSSKGAGMANINYRVQYFNGTFDIVTAPGNGTSVNIELKA